MTQVRPTYGEPVRSVVFVDPFPIAREGLLRLLADARDFNVIGAWGTCGEAARHLSRVKVDLLVVTLNGEDSLALLRRARSLPARPAVLGIFEDGSDEVRGRALEAGATGYLPRSATPAMILAAMRDVIQVEAQHASRVATPEFEQRSDPNHIPPEQALSRRELEVFSHLGLGKTSRQVADALNLSVKTVATHRASILAKLGAKTTTELLRRAVLWSARRGPHGHEP
jgi:DNA-binding NarL/FixJ family response regulator